MSTFACYPSFGLTRVHVIGCGGTGSRAVPLIAQFLASLPRPETKEMFLYDFDSVEEKNLVRQNFVSVDVGKFKAEVLAGRYSAAYRIPIKAVTERFSHDEARLQPRDVVVMCVDSVHARLEVLRELAEAGTASQTPLLTWPGILVLDAGNENDFGQIVSWTLLKTPRHHVSYLDRPEDPDTGLVDLEILPFPLSHYVKICKENIAALTAPGPSCADLDQTLAINAQMGVGIMSLLQNWHYRKPVKAQTVYYNLTGNAATPTPIGKDCLEYSQDTFSRTIQRLAENPSAVSIVHLFRSSRVTGEPELKPAAKKKEEEEVRGRNVTPAPSLAARAGLLTPLRPLQPEAATAVF